MYLHISIEPTRVPLLLILANKLPTLMMLDNFIDESLLVVTTEMEESGRVLRLLRNQSIGL